MRQFRSVGRASNNVIYEWDEVSRITWNDVHSGSSDGYPPRVIESLLADGRWVEIFPEPVLADSEWIAA